MSTDLVIVGVSLVSLLEPLGAATVQDLFSQPHEADEGTEGACDNKTALETVCQQVVSATQQPQVIYQSGIITKKTNCAASKLVKC